MRDIKMIIGNINEQVFNKSANEKINNAILIIRKTDFGKALPGKNTTENDEVFFNYISAYASALQENEVEFEAHKEYADIHVMLRGEEFIYLSKTDKLVKKTEYDIAGDYALFAGTASEKVKLKAGDYLVCMPEDAHAPLINCGFDGEIQKAVFKVRL